MITELKGYAKATRMTFSKVLALILALALESEWFTANALKLVSAVIVGITLSVPAIRAAGARRRTQRGAKRHA